MKSRIIRSLLAIVLLVCIAYSVIQILNITSEYDKAEAIQSDMMVYKPPAPPDPRPQETTAPAETVQTAGTAETPPRTPIVNRSIIDAQQNVNSDIVGWLTIPGTRIDYLFVQTVDNDFYLHTDLNKNHAYAGTIFMDFRNNPAFSDFNTILYGHHMKNGSMFKTLQNFQETGFFSQWRTGTIYLPHRILTLEIFAYMVITSDDAVIYTTQPESADDFTAYVRRNARQYREAELTETDKIVTLSTCGYEYEGARIVLLAKLSEE